MAGGHIGLLKQERQIQIGCLRCKKKCLQEKKQEICSNVSQRWTRRVISVMYGSVKKMLRRIQCETGHYMRAEKNDIIQTSCQHSPIPLSEGNVGPLGCLLHIGKRGLYAFSKLGNFFLLLESQENRVVHINTEACEFQNIFREMMQRGKEKKNQTVQSILKAATGFLLVSHLLMRAGISKRSAAKTAFLSDVQLQKLTGIQPLKPSVEVPEWQRVKSRFIFSPLHYIQDPFEADTR